MIFCSSSNQKQIQRVDTMQIFHVNKSPSIKFALFCTFTSNVPIFQLCLQQNVVSNFWSFARRVGEKWFISIVLVLQWGWYIWYLLLKLSVIFSLSTKQKHTDTENRHVVAKAWGEVGGEMNWQFGVVWICVLSSCTTLCNPMGCSHQSPLFMEFSRQEYWSRLPFPSPGNLPNPGNEPASPALAARFLTTVLPVKSSLQLVDTKMISYRMDGCGPTV